MEFTSKIYYFRFLAYLKLGQNHNLYTEIVETCFMLVVFSEDVIFEYCSFLGSANTMTFNATGTIIG